MSNTPDGQDSRRGAATASPRAVGAIGCAVLSLLPIVGLPFAVAGVALALTAWRRRERLTNVAAVLAGAALSFSVLMLVWALYFSPDF